MARIIRYCKYCGEKIRRIPSPRRNPNICSITCSRNYRLKLHSRRKELLTELNQIDEELGWKKKDDIKQNKKR